MTMCRNQSLPVDGRPLTCVARKFHGGKHSVESVNRDGVVRYEWESGKRPELVAGRVPSVTPSVVPDRPDDDEGVPVRRGRPLGDWGKDAVVTATLKRVDLEAMDLPARPEAPREPTLAELEDQHPCTETPPHAPHIVQIRTGDLIGGWRCDGHGKAMGRTDDPEDLEPDERQAERDAIATAESGLAPVVDDVGVTVAYAATVEHLVDERDLAAPPVETAALTIPEHAVTVEPRPAPKPDFDRARQMAEQGYGAAHIARRCHVTEAEAAKMGGWT